MQIDSSKLIKIGSRALGVYSTDSDTDACILYSDLPKGYLESKRPVFLWNIEYSKSLLLRHSLLYKVGNLDLFVFDDPTKLLIVYKVMRKLKKWPKFLLKKKWFRVQLFRLLLRLNGFTKGST